MEVLSPYSPMAKDTHILMVLLDCLGLSITTTHLDALFLPLLEVCDHPVPICISNQAQIFSGLTFGYDQGKAMKILASPFSHAHKASSQTFS
jgi:hypothetical protein